MPKGKGKRAAKAKSTRTRKAKKGKTSSVSGKTDKRKRETTGKRSAPKPKRQKKMQKSKPPAAPASKPDPPKEYEEQKMEFHAANSTGSAVPSLDEDAWAGGWESGDEDWGDIEADCPPAADANRGSRAVEHYTFLDPDELHRERENVVQTVVNLAFPDQPKAEAADKASALLRAFNWNVQRLQETFFGDPEKCLIDSGIKPDPNLLEEHPPPAAGGLIECPQCYDDFPSDKMMSLSCGHQSCKDCWKDYLSYENGLANLNLTCNRPNCKMVILDSVWDSFLSEEDQIKRRKWQRRAYIEGRPTMKACPAPDCKVTVVAAQEIAQLESDGRILPEVTCTCGYMFCFKCCRVAHRPAPCSVAKEWIEKCSSEAENANWIIANTKKCPKCDTQIEKNQGCNHMTCSRCKHEFCWLCKGSWKEHGNATGGYYRCNRWEASQKTGSKTAEEEDAENAKNSLQKYLFYFKRFDNHSKSRQLAIKSLETTGDRMAQLRGLKAGNGGGFNDVSFLEDAVKTVIECRRVLQWTYAMGYYLDKGPEKNLFENLQEMLEKNCEHLHGLAEQELEKLCDEKSKTDINNYTRVTRNFLGNMIEGIEGPKGLLNAKK